MIDFALKLYFDHIDDWYSFISQFRATEQQSKTIYCKIPNYLLM